MTGRKAGSANRTDSDTQTEDGRKQRQEAERQVATGRQIHMQTDTQKGGCSGTDIETERRC